MVGAIEADNVTHIKLTNRHICSVNISGPLDVMGMVNYAYQVNPWVCVLLVFI